MENKKKVINEIDRSFKYIPIKFLGEGTYGKVHIVQCTEDKTYAVIKTVPLDNLSDSAKQSAYLESKILEKLDHPNIIKLREVFLTKSKSTNLHLVMDYADGGDLQTKIQFRKNYFAESQIIDWFTQICLAIKHIHDRKIIHRDLKSQNIFLMKNNILKLGDFGIAKCLSYTIEQAQTIAGTPFYLSPEIVQSKPYSFKSDIWSLGILLYEMCALKMPFNGENLPKLCLNIVKGQYSQIPSHYSIDLKLLVTSLLRVDQDQRPSVNEILNMRIIKKRIKEYLNEMEFTADLSSTIKRNKFNQVRGLINQEICKVEKEKNINEMIFEDYEQTSVEPKNFYMIKNSSKINEDNLNLNRPIHTKINSAPENKKSDLKNIKNVLEKHKKNTSGKDNIKVIKQQTIRQENNKSFKNSVSLKESDSLDNFKIFEQEKSKLDCNISNSNINPNSYSNSNILVYPTTKNPELLNTHRMLVELSEIDNQDIEENIENIHEDVIYEMEQFDYISEEDLDITKVFKSNYFNDHLELINFDEIQLNIK